MLRSVDLKNKRERKKYDIRRSFRNLGDVISRGPLFFEKKINVCSSSIILRS